MVAIREHLVLLGEERAAGVDEVDAGQPVLERDLLRPQVLLHGQRIVGAALDGGVVAHHHHVPAVDQADARDHSRAGRIAAIEPLRGERRQLDERAALVEKPTHPVAGEQLAAGDVTFTGRLGAAGCRLREPFTERACERLLGSEVLLEPGVVHRGVRQCAHGISVDHRRPLPGREDFS